VRYVQRECFGLRSRFSDPEGERSARRKPAATARAARSAKRKTSVVLELLRGADLELTRRKYRFTASTLSEWRDAFLAGGAEALKVRQEAQLDEQGRRMNDAIAEMAIEIELLRERIRRMEDLKMFCGFAQLDQPGRTLPSSGAWRTRSLFCGGGRACEPRPVGLHRADVGAALGC
jgi:hypothetical protein